MFSASNQYSVIKQLGSGGFGFAYLVKQLAVDDAGYVNDRLYVIKEVNLGRLEANAGDAESRAKVRSMAFDEAEIMKSLDNQNIVKVYSSFLEGDVFRISMEYCDSGTLKDAIVAQRGVYFAEQQVRHWMAQLVTTLKFLHNQRILHRDVKADNVFLTANRSVVKLGDFGIAKTLNNTSAGHTFIGTVTHMPPELLRGESYSFKAEVWALGVLMYETMALRLPFYGNHFAMVFQAIMGPEPAAPLPSSAFSAELRDLIERKLLNKNVAERPTMLEIIGESFILQTIAEMANFRANPAMTPSSGTPSVMTPNSSTPASSNPPKLESMFQAAQNGDLDTIREILAAYPAEELADPMTWGNLPQNADFDTPLHLAAWRDQAEALRLMWPVMGSHLGAWQNNDKQAPIHLAALSNARKAVEFFGQVQPNLLELRSDCLGRNALHAAAERGHFDLVKELVSNYKIDITAKTSTEDDEKLAIHLAAYQGHLQIVDFMLDQCPYLVDARTRSGDWPLHLAAMGGQVAMVEYFVKLRGLSPECRNDSYGRTVLHLACEFGHFQLVQKMIEEMGADLWAKSSPERDFEKLPIHMAAWQGHLETVRYLVGIDRRLIDARDGQGMTPLQRAESSGSLNDAPKICAFLKQLVA